MDDLDCNTKQNLKGAVSLLEDEAYQWWLTVKEEGARFSILVVKAKVTEDVERAERQNRETDRGRSKKVWEPSSSARRPKKKAKVDGPIRPVIVFGPQSCAICGKLHQGACWVQMEACLRYGSLEDRIRPALVYAARCREDGDTPDVITGTFFILNVPCTALIDVGPTHSYVACTVSETLGVMVENTTTEVTILSPLGQSVRVNKLFKDVPLEIQGMIFLADLMEFPFGELDMILGMDWLVKHQVNLDCATKTIKDFSNVFLDELLGLPPNHEVDFGIELLSGTTPVPIAPFKMAPKELKAQIQELLDQGFIRPSVSP
ncbi:uncharacterized protein [Gossypium hirsutum]|uniref:Uncharacterized protein n=1 Tax=Gossypium hirsutum TaxID=3635 RepID=A0A1U8IEA0_GOSHI|nr:uncharacterized protein LOC107895661 [Gossypium hirsutum]